MASLGSIFLLPCDTCVPFDVRCSRLQYASNCRLGIKAQTIGNTRNALCDLIDDHNLTDRLAIRLVHKHFDLEENELAVFQSINVDDVALGPVVTLSPLSASNITEYIGKHFLFNGDTLVAYEWIANNVGDGVDLSKYPEFTSAFIETLVAGNATEIFGLATISDYDKVLLSEFEIPHLRTTVMVSECLLSPDADTSVIDTNWIV
ncbi:hypothetical protein BT96DRAFT_1021267 [Gymnopus androsaceus JB14]|uniref:Uncharacterized protein n=1 Tax=Gymnopus androsaceus JB14 TaxID=1447944 RepID=A0A6A4HFX9_9AGAR|nr:hypothetical protein BT96DRAFT_1021267 [Gymnopus androsaceus JB14]